MIFGREPARWIALGVTLIIGVVTTLAGDSLISDAVAGKVTDIVHAVAQLLVLISPLIAGEVIRTQVTPVNSP